MSTKKILIIDDDRVHLNFYAELHKNTENNYDFFIAENGDEAMDLIQTEQPDKIILDLLIPGKNGFEILEFISTQNKETKVYIVSNIQKSEAEKRIKKFPNIEYFEKVTTSSQTIKKLFEE